NLRVALSGAFQVVEGEDVRIGRRGGLLEAAIRHLEDAVEALDELAEARRIDLHERLGTALDGVLRQTEGDARRLAQDAAVRRLDALPFGNNFDLLTNAIAEVAGRRGHVEAVRADLLRPDTVRDRAHLLRPDVEVLV